MHDKKADQNFPPGNIEENHGDYYPDGDVDELGDHQHTPVDNGVREIAIG